MKQLLLVGLSLLLVSCNIHRLFTFKHQLSMIDRYFLFDQPGIIQLNHPVLRISDIEFLTGIQPTKYTCQTNSICVAQYDFIQSDTQFFRYQLIFVDGALAQIEYPDIFVNFISKSFAIQTLASIGQANLMVNQSIKAIKTVDTTAPTKPEIDHVFGHPTIIQQFPTAVYALYEYTHPTENGMQYVSIAFLYSTMMDRVDTVFIHLPGRRWSIDVSDF